MSTETVMHVRLAEQDQTFLDEMVAKGFFTNKSEVLRTALHLYRYSALCDRMLKINPRQKSVSQIVTEVKQIRKQIGKRYR